MGLWQDLPLPKSCRPSTAAPPSINYPSPPEASLIRTDEKDLGKLKGKYKGKEGPIRDRARRPPGPQQGGGSVGNSVVRSQGNTGLNCGCVLLPKNGARDP